MDSDRELLEKAAQHEELAQRVAKIVGPSSAAQQALDEANALRKEGIPAAVVNVGKSWVVVRAAAALSENKQ